MEYDIKDFSAIQDVYDFIEVNGYSLERKDLIMDLWIKFREHSQLDEEKQKAQWEVECFLFSFIGGYVFSLSTSTGKGLGEVQRYPMLDKHQVEAFDYIKQRALNSKCPLLVSRYNHLLWGSIKGVKNKIFAEKAIVSYADLIERYKQYYEKTSDGEFAFKIGRVYETLVLLTSEIKYEIEKLKILTNRLLSPDVNLPFYLKEGIIRDMLKYPKIFEIQDFKDVLMVFEYDAKDKDRNGSLWMSCYLPTAIKVAKKIHTDEKRWQNELGQAYFENAEKEHQEDRYWLKLNDYARAIEAFDLAKNEAKKRKAEEAYFQLKPKVKLPTVEIHFSNEEKKGHEELLKEVDLFAKHILTQPAANVYEFLAKYPLLPKRKNIQDQVNQTERSFLGGISTIYFDNNKNISNSKPNGDYENNLSSTYGYNLRFFLLPLLHKVYTQGIESGHLTYENFLEYLTTKTWVGKPYLKTDLGGNEIQVNYLQLIAPSIIEYFAQIQAWTSSKYYIPSFVLCVDSLTLKIEGLLRNFCERLLIPTSTPRKKGMQELYIQDILKHELIAKYFDEDDLLLFNYVLGNEGGLNLRNNIAHCFYGQDDYYPDLMYLLLQVLMRISKYDHKRKDGSI